MSQSKRGAGPKRKVRSFVRRDSRITPAQLRAIEDHLDTYTLPPDALLEPRATTLQIMEIGAGDGECAIAYAGARPHDAYLAVEVYRPGLGRLLARTHELGLSNLRVGCSDATELIDAAGREIFDRVLIFFPDPWPKKKHHKRRLLKAAFLDALAPKLSRAGRLYVATDIADYALEIGAYLDASDAWSNLAGPGRFAPRPRFRLVTKFERRAISEQREIYEFTAARSAPGQCDRR